jgi:hypothetical protein
LSPAVETGEEADMSARHKEEKEKEKDEDALWCEICATVMAVQCRGVGRLIKKISLNGKVDERSLFPSSSHGCLLLLSEKREREREREMTAVLGLGREADRRILWCGTGQSKDKPTQQPFFLFCRRLFWACRSPPPEIL